MLSSCPPDRTQLDALVDGELPTVEARALERHVESCETCRREVESLRAVRILVRCATTESPVPPDLVARMRSELAAARHRERQALARRRSRVLDAALLVLGLSLGFAAGRVSAPAAPLSSAALAPPLPLRQEVTTAVIYPDASRIETVTLLPGVSPANLGVPGEPLD